LSQLQGEGLVRSQNVANVICVADFHTFLSLTRQYDTWPPKSILNKKLPNIQSLKNWITNKKIIQNDSHLNNNDSSYLELNR
jgi:hypothetical protein